MTIFLQKIYLLRLVLSCAFFAVLLAVPALGQTVTFAQFFEQNGTQDFVWTNNGGISGTFANVPGGSPIFFTYQNISGLPAELQGIQIAHMSVTTTAFLAGSVSGPNLTQPLDQVITIDITRDTPASPGTGGGNRTRLLRVVISPAINNPGLVGNNGGNSATLSATTPDHIVTFSSHFLSFGATTDRNMALSFSSVTPAVSLGAGSFLQSVTAAGSGTFASNPVPTYGGPTAAAVRVAGRVLGPSGMPVRNAEVRLTDQNGVVRSARTTAFGYFAFEGIQAGQVVLLNVLSKRYTYQPQVISLTDSATDLTFMPTN
ncbi:MAG: carboxypeptidase regulatory-like domain-containing protein [Acidobacteria bacterium]|nr:carboxypeptidase regulatory-like domain-containing protein [Acidobacteriota bacterium]